MSFLLDTNVVSEWRKTPPNAGVEAWASQVHLEDLYVSVITIGEIRRGISKLLGRNDHQQAMAIETWLAVVKGRFAGRIVPVTVEIAEEWGDAHARHPVAVPDGLIAATAKIRGWTVITRNVKDFEHVGVRVVNPFTE
jgi:hypothetical protein